MPVPAKYWAKGKKTKKINVTRDQKGDINSYQWDRDTNEIPFILFKNANNGCGVINSLEEPIKDYTLIEHHFVSKEQKHQVCEMLQYQLSEEYVVVEPDDKLVCIVIRMRDCL